MKNPETPNKPVPWTQRELKSLPTSAKLQVQFFFFVLLSCGIFASGYFVELGMSKYIPGEVIPSLNVRDVKSSAAGIVFEITKNAGEHVAEGDVLAVLYFDERGSREVHQLLTELKGFLYAYGVEAPLPVFPHKELPTLSVKDLESKYKDLQTKYQRCAVSYEKKRTRTTNEVAPLQAQESNFIARIEKLKAAKPTTSIKRQIEEARLERESLKTRIAILKNQIDSEYFDLSQALVADTKDYTEYLENILQTREIKSPMNGRLGPFKIVKGTAVTNNQVLTAIMPDNSEPMFQGVISSNDAKKLRVGQKINIRLFTQETAEGTIISLDRAKGSSLGSIQMKATVSFAKGRAPAQESQMPDGVKAEASIYIDSKSLISVLFSRFYEWPH